MKTDIKHIDSATHRFLRDHHLLIDVVIILSFLLMLSLLFAESAH